MADHGLTTRIPIWVRVSGIIALVLVGVVVGSLLLGRISTAGPGGGGQGQMGRMDHNPGAQPTGSAAPTGHAGTPGPSGQHTPSDGGRGH